MKFLNKILNAIVVRKPTLVIIAGSATCYLLSFMDKSFSQSLVFVPALFVQGEYWRLLTFLFYPISSHPIFAFFVYYFYFFMGTALEAVWGEGRYTRFILSAAAMTIALSFFTPYHVVTNLYIMISIFWAFAILFPDFEVLLFFFIPMRVKYIAIFSFTLTLVQAIMGDLATRLSLLAVSINFLMFFYGHVRALSFGAGFFKRASNIDAPYKNKTENTKTTDTFFHECAQCQRTENSSEDISFRVCGKCNKEYCLDHLKDHPHATNS